MMTCIIRYLTKAVLEQIEGLLLLAVNSSACFEQDN